jgi:hypothetical protein
VEKAKAQDEISKDILQKIVILTKMVKHVEKA